MCNEPVIRTPANGLAFAYFARIAIRPGISCSAISISFRPNSARPRSATLWSTAVLVVTLLMYFELGQVLIESFGSIRTLPGKRFQVILAPEMTVVGRLPIDWAQEIQLFDDRCRLEVEYLLHGLLNFYFIYLRGSKRVDAYADRIGITDGVSELNFTPVGQTSRYHILSDVPAHIRCGSIYLRGVFTGKRAAAVAAHSTIGVDDDLSSGQTRITFRATNYKSDGRIDEIACFGVNPLQRHNLPDHSFNDSLANFFMFYFGSVLGRDDYCIDTYWTKSIVFD